VDDITTEAELRELLGEPAPAALAKERSQLHELDREWLAASRFCLVATSGADGSCDVSPKGDPAGFTLVLDERTVAVPERAGNRRADGYRNILANPHVGLLYLLPGRGDTLRINGRARLTRDPELLDRMLVRGHRPVLAMVVEVEQSKDPVLLTPRKLGVSLGTGPTGLRARTRTGWSGAASGSRTSSATTASSTRPASTRRRRRPRSAHSCGPAA
jgi:PPOX class probable FMN-dependent enzyme